MTKHRNGVKTKRQVKAAFRASGLTIKDWARANGFSPGSVYVLLNSDRPAIRGEAHRIAVALGMKPKVTMFGAYEQSAR